MNSVSSDISKISQAMQLGELSSVELCKDYFRRISESSDLNAFITLDEENALEQAQAIDGKRSHSSLGELAGIPIAHKDIFCTKGLLTTCGSRILGNFVSPYDATLVAKLKEKQTILLGKTNMDEFAMGSSSEHSYFGPVRNPWDTSLVPGGSSGGLGSSSRRGPHSGSNRNRHGWVNSPTCCALRNYRNQTKLRKSFAIWHDRIRIVA